MNTTLLIIFLCSTQLAFWFLGKRASRKTKDTNDYYLAGKSVGFFPLMMTFFATQVGGGLVLGAAEEAYHLGWAVLLYPMGAALGLLCLGAGLGRKLAAFKVTTVAQILEEVYRSKALRKAAALLSVLSLFMILVAQMIATQKFFNSLGLHSPFLFIACWLLVILYTARGGLTAVISTDIVQACFFTCIFALAFVFAYFFNKSEVVATNFEAHALFTTKWTGWLLMPLLFMIIEQDMAQRCFAGTNAKVISLASLFSGFATLLIASVPIFFGILAQKLQLTIPEGSSVLMEAVRNTTHPTITALVGAAVIAAIFSTATSLINAISSNLMNDFSTKKESSLKTAKRLTFMFSIGALIFAFYFDNIVDLLIQSYELSVSCLFVPITFALFRKQGNPYAAWGAVFGGALGFCLVRAYPNDWISKEILSLSLSTLGFFCGLNFTSAHKKNPMHNSSS